MVNVYRHANQRSIFMKDSLSDREPTHLKNRHVPVKDTDENQDRLLTSSLLSKPTKLADGRGLRDALL
ncbi:MAG: hypothetical protein D6742_15480 [Cyanobacteria bacterium J069]|nr:MAG: hypothetical protein D6742_15480 [Cyanobacteria bacterium J069]